MRWAFLVLGLADLIEQERIVMFPTLYFTPESVVDMMLSLLTSHLLPLMYGRPWLHYFRMPISSCC